MKKRILLKVCGMRDAMNMMDVAALEPDFMGFIFYHGSKRYVGDDFKIPASFPQQIKRVGVFVNEEMDIVKKMSKEFELDYVQLHGDESKGYCEELREVVKVIKVFLVDSWFDFSITNSYQEVCDYFLFDTKSESRGGSGRSFDWSLLNRYKGGIPFFLSGGLSINNISEALSFDHPMFFAVDVNSGVESDYGIKSIDKIKNLKSEILNSLK
jgi:phosphoribosylanthranilate isomerase